MGPRHEGVVEGPALPEAEDVGLSGSFAAPSSRLPLESPYVGEFRPPPLTSVEPVPVGDLAANPLEQHRAIVRRWGGYRSSCAAAPTSVRFPCHHGQRIWRDACLTKRQAYGRFIRPE
ncbi:hypothetical protein STTU_1522 [Streptomyces sp. Tu6071]|nr:hypothetical protein STTU_1522 [Streptomyces sp. Tu6071]